MRSWLVLGLLSAFACDPPGPPASSHPGTPLELGPEDGPFTRERLVEIARYYYPSMEYTELRHPSEVATRIERSTPEWRARNAAIQRAMQDRDPWRDLVAELERALPAYHVTDRTITYLLEPSYAIELAPRDPTHQGEIVAMVSVLAPVYVIGQVVSSRTMRHPIDPAFQPAVNTLERAILARYPYQRVDHEAAFTIVPERAAGNQWYRETTLLDLLFYASW